MKVFRTTPLALVVLVPLLGGCDLLGPQVRHFAEARTYEHPLFESPEDCEAAQPPDFHINCFQWMDFHPDGEVTVVVTDIVNPGRYRITGDRVTLDMEPSPELPARIRLRLSADESTITDLDTGTVWTRVEPEI